MNTRQKRLCRALLDYYDASGAQPCPLADLAKKTGYHLSDIYDKDSQSGDLWPFDAKARGSLAGLLAFTGGKTATVSITASGLTALEKLCQEETAPPIKTKPGETQKPMPTAPQFGTVAPAPKPSVPTSQKVFSADDVTDARSRFKYWLKSDSAGSAMLVQFDGEELLETAFNKFFAEFLKYKE